MLILQVAGVIVGLIVFENTDMSEDTGLFILPLM